MVFNFEQNGFLQILQFGLSKSDKDFVKYSLFISSTFILLK